MEFLKPAAGKLEIHCSKPGKRRSGLNGDISTEAGTKAIGRRDTEGKIIQVLAHYQRAETGSFFPRARILEASSKQGLQLCWPPGQYHTNLYPPSCLIPQTQKTELMCSRDLAAPSPSGYRQKEGEVGQAAENVESHPLSPSLRYPPSISASSILILREGKG